MRALRAPGGTDLGSYRYTAFGQPLVDTTTLTQSLRWKGRWYSPIGGGIYDVRARQWTPEIGVFLSIDDYQYQGAESTLRGWPNQNPSRYPDPTGHVAGAAVGGGALIIAGAIVTYLLLQEAAECSNKKKKPQGPCHGAPLGKVIFCSIACAPRAKWGQDAWNACMKECCFGAN